MFYPPFPAPSEARSSLPNAPVSPDRTRRRGRKGARS